MNDFIKERFKALEEEVALFNEMGIAPVKRLTGITQAVRQALDDSASYISAQYTDPQAMASFIVQDQPQFYQLVQTAMDHFLISLDERRFPFSGDEADE